MIDPDDFVSHFKLLADLQRDREGMRGEIARLKALLGERDAKIAELYGFRSHYTDSKDDGESN